MKGEREKKTFAKKSLGQNFLVDQNYINKIIHALAPQPDQRIVEIGAGRGALTEKLVESGANVIAIELDRNLIPDLQNQFKAAENFTLIEADALQINFDELIAENRKPQIENCKLAANLPYYISTAILQHLIEYRNVFSEMILMFQKEVVERITAEPRTKQRGFLTVLVEAFFETEKLFDVPPTAFQPQPKVQSSVVRLITKEGGGNIKDYEIFRELVGNAFRQKRKTIQNNLKNAEKNLQNVIKTSGGLDKILEAAEIEPRRRAESLSLAEWQKLSDLLIK